MTETTVLKSCCDYYEEGMLIINNPIFLEAARNDTKGYTGRKIKYCPWCGKELIREFVK